MRAWLDERAVVLQSAALEASDVAALLLNGDGRVISITRAAEHILRNTKALSCTHGRLAGGSGPANTAIQTAVAKVTQQPHRLQGDRVHSKIELRGDVVEHLTLRFAPISRDVDDLPSGAVAIVTLEAATDNHRPQNDHIEAFNLTPAQHRLVMALVSGHTLNSYSETAGISVNTARNQLRQVFHKTGASRQSELIRAFGGFDIKTEHKS